jgi:hypothetical protein
MDASTPAATGWPFLVAAGRRRDYTTLLAPRFLLADLDHGVLEQVVRPDAEPGRPTVVTVRTGRGRRLSVVSATHLLTAADLDGPDSDGADAHDEHGRPLRLIYGFTVPDVSTVDPDPADLRRALVQALPVYRSFLRDEEHATVVGSPAFRLRSAVESPVPPPVDAAPAGTLRWLVTAVAVLLAVVVGFGLWRAVRPSAPGPTPCASVLAPGPLSSCPPSPRR